MVSLGRCAPSETSLKLAQERDSSRFRSFIKFAILAIHSQARRYSSMCSKFSKGDVNTRPVVIRVLAGIISTIAAFWLVRRLSRTTTRTNRKALLEAAMKSAKCYRDWKKAAAELDHMEQAAKVAKLGPNASCRKLQLAFDEDTERAYGRALLEKMHGRAVAGGCAEDVEDMISALRAGLINCLHGLKKARQRRCTRRVGLPSGAKQYIQDVRRVLKYLTDHEYPEFGPQDKLVLLKETQLAMGRSALVLSGGAAIGCFHIGIVKTLLLQNLLPRIVVGSSAGAIVAGIVGTHTDSELHELVSKFPEVAEKLKFFSDASPPRRVLHWARTGALMKGVELECTLRDLYGDLTFAEAYERTGRVFCVSICSTRPRDKPRVLCHLTAPHTVVWSAVFASSAFPGLFPSRDLLHRNHAGDYVLGEEAAAPGARVRWRDGSLESDLPLQTVAELFNVQFFIISQTNPHIIPLLHVRKMMYALPWANAFVWMGRQIENEFKMRCGQIKRIMGSGMLFWAASLFYQDWTGRDGDVTVACPSSWGRISRCIENPSRQEFVELMLSGEKAMWPVLSLLKCHCRVELELAACAAKLQRTTRKEHPGLEALAQRGSMCDPKRCPSWNTLMHIALGESEDGE